MDEFKLSAVPCFTQETNGDAIAAVSASTLTACFSAMAAEVAKWLPGALAGGGVDRPPHAIELTLEWSGASPELPAGDGPERPCDPTHCVGRSHRPRLCLAVRGFDGEGAVALRPRPGRPGTSIRAAV